MNFFSNTLKRKKLILFSVLFLVVLSIFSTIKIDIVKAQDTTETYTPAQADPNTCKDLSSWSYVDQFLAAAADLSIWIPEQLAQIATNVSSFVISVVINWPITNGGNGAAQAFTAGWASCRDLGNMLIVLGLVIVGIATALRIQEYGAKKFLVKIILVALLINFSGLLCGIIIDASNLTMTGLLPQGTSDMSTKFVERMGTIETSIQCAAIPGEKLGLYVATDISFGFIYIAIAICFLYLAFILIGRYAILGILFILSPLAFAFYAFPFPDTHKLWTRWWEHFIKWAFVGIGVCFFLNLASNMLSAPAFMNAINTSTDTMVITEYLCVVLLVIIVGIKITTNVSGIASAAVMGIATGGAGLAMGAIAGGAKLAGRGTNAALSKATGGKVDIGGAAQRISNSTGRAMENLGLRKKGTTAQNMQKPMTETASRISAMSEDDKTKLATRGANTVDGVRAKVAAIQDKVKNGKLDDLGKTTQEQANAIQYAESYIQNRGIDTGVRKNAEKLNPNLARHNEANLQKLTAGTTGGRGPMDRASAERIAVSEATRKATPSDAVKWDASVITPEVFGHMSKSQAIEIGKRGSPELANEIKKYTPKLHPVGHPQAGQRLDYTQQSAEYQKARDYMLKNYKGGAANPEIKRVTGVMDELATNPVFN